MQRLELALAESEALPSKALLDRYNIHSEEDSTQTWSFGKVKSLSPYLGGPFPRKDGFWPWRKESSSDLPGAGTHSRPDRWQRMHFAPVLSPNSGG